MPRWRAPLIPVLVFSAASFCIVVLYRGSRALFNQYDDAYITYRYAIQLARGNGLVYNIGERIDSASSFLHVVLLSLAYRIGVHNLESVATWLGVGFASGSAVIVYLALQHLTKRALVAFQFAILTALHGFMSGWAVAGMDATLFSFFVVTFIYLFFVRCDTGPASATMLALVVVTRVEGALLVVAAVIGLACGWQSQSRRWQTAALLLGPALGAGGALVLFRIGYYGRALPDAFHFKHIWSAYQPRPSELLDSWQSAAIIAVLLAVGGLARLPDARARLGVGSYLALSIGSLLLGPRSGWARYSIHLLPIVMILAGVAVAGVWARMRVLAVTWAIAAGWQTYGSAKDMRAFLEKTAYAQQCRKEVGRYLAEHGSDHPVLSSDLGAIGYEAINVSFIDAVGLTSPDVLQAYLSGGSLDPIFDTKQPMLVADTWYRSYSNYQALKVLQSPSSYIKGGKGRVAPPSYLSKRTAGFPLHQCKSPDGLVFSIAPLVPGE